MKEKDKLTSDIETKAYADGEILEDFGRAAELLAVAIASRDYLLCAEEIMKAHNKVIIMATLAGLKQEFSKKQEESDD